MSDTSDGQGIAVIYDGECPFCSAYVRVLRLRKAAGSIELIDARSDHPLVAQAKARGLDLDDGMAMLMGGQWSHGDEVIHRLALMSGPSGALNRLQAWAFKSPLRSRLLYPWLRAGRNITLKIRGRTRIDGAPF